MPFWLDQTLKGVVLLIAIVIELFALFLLAIGTLANGGAISPLDYSGTLELVFIAIWALLTTASVAGCMWGWRSIDRLDQRLRLNTA